MKTAELKGAYLDYFTGLADGKDREKLSIRRVQRTDTLICVYNGIVRYDPSMNAEKGLDLIERERINLHATHLEDWRAWIDESGCIERGDTALIAACRVKVASIYGDEVPEIEITE